jgi:hypothetical protein
MNALIRWGSALGLAGGILLGSVAMPYTQAWALTQDQVMTKLRGVPLFTITNADGSPLVATATNNAGKQAPVAGAFVSRKDAEAFLNKLKTQDPKLPKDVRIVPVSLAEIYKISLQEKGKPDSLEFAYIPLEQQVSLALTILKQTDPKATKFEGVPLFVARAGKDKGYLTIQQGNQPIIPLFFEKEQLQSMLERFKQQQPDLASTIDIQVLNLEGVIKTMETSKDPQLNQLLLIPPQESIEFLRSTGGGGAGGGTTPAPAPAAPKPAAPKPKGK